MEPSEGIWKSYKGHCSCNMYTGNHHGQNKMLLQVSGVCLAVLLLGLALQNLPQALFSCLPQNRFTSTHKSGLGLRETIEELSDCVWSPGRQKGTASPTCNLEHSCPFLGCFLPPSFAVIVSVSTFGMCLSLCKSEPSVS